MRSAAAVVLFFLAASAQAHPGHGLATLWHLLTEPDHLAMILLPAAIAVAVGVRALSLRRKKSGSDPRRRKYGV